MLLSLIFCCSAHVALSLSHCRILAATFTAACCYTVIALPLLLSHHCSPVTMLFFLHPLCCFPIALLLSSPLQLCSNHHALVDGLALLHSYCHHLIAACLMLPSLPLIPILLLLHSHCHALVPMLSLLFSHCHTLITALPSPHSLAVAALLLLLLCSHHCSLVAKFLPWTCCCPCSLQLLCFLHCILIAMLSLLLSHCYSLIATLSLLLSHCYSLIAVLSLLCSCHCLLISMFSCHACTTALQLLHSCLTFSFLTLILCVRLKYLFITTSYFYTSFFLLLIVYIYLSTY